MIIMKYLMTSHLPWQQLVKFLKNIKLNLTCERLNTTPTPCKAILLQQNPPVLPWWVREQRQKWLCLLYGVPGMACSVYTQLG